MNLNQLGFICIALFESSLLALYFAGLKCRDILLRKFAGLFTYGGHRGKSKRQS